MLSEEAKDRLATYAIVTALALGFCWGLLMRLVTAPYRAWRDRHVTEDDPDF